MLRLFRWYFFSLALIFFGESKLISKTIPPLLAKAQQQKDTSKSKIDALKQSIATMKTTQDLNAVKKMRTDNATNLNQARIQAYAYAMTKRYSDYFDAKEQLLDDKNDLDKINLEVYKSLDDLNLPELLAETGQAKKNIDGINLLAEQTSLTPEMIQQAQVFYDDFQKFLPLKKLNEAQANLEKMYAQRVKTLVAQYPNLPSAAPVNTAADTIIKSMDTVIGMPEATTPEAKKTVKDLVIAGKSSRKTLRDLVDKLFTDVNAGLINAFWALNEVDEIFFRSGVTNQNLIGTGWQKIEGLLKSIVSNNRGNVWGINRGREIFFRTGITPQMPIGTGWQKIDGSLDCIAINNQSAVWGTNADKAVFFRTGVTAQNPAGTGWQNVPGEPLVNITVNNRGDVWALNEKDEIFFRTGISVQEPAGKAWQKVEGLLKVISAQDKIVWGVNANDDIFFRAGVTAQTPMGTGWQVIDGKLKHIFASARGDFSGVNARGDAFFRTGVTAQKMEGSGWQVINGKFKYISLAQVTDSVAQAFTKVAADRAAAEPSINRLNKGQQLFAGQSLKSSNGKVVLIYQTDGNLVLYDAQNNPLWANNKNGTLTNTVVMQSDGNLGHYDIRGASVWASNTNGNPDAYLLLQDDYNLVLYSKDNKPLWATNTKFVSPTPAPTQASNSSLAQGFAKSLNDLPAGTIIALQSLKDEKFLTVADGKYLRPLTSISAIDLTRTAQFRVLRDGNYIGFQLMDGNNKLQAVPPGSPAAPGELGHIVRFENQNFLEWEKYTLEFEPNSNVVFIKSFITGGFLSNRDAGEFSGGRATTCDHLKNPAGKGPFEKFRIKIITSPSIADGLPPTQVPILPENIVDAFFNTISDQRILKVSESSNPEYQGKGIANIFQGLIKNGRIVMPKDQVALFGDPDPSSPDKYSIVTIRRGNPSVPALVVFAHGQEGVWTWGDQDIYRAGKASGLWDQGANEGYRTRAANGTLPK